MKGYTDAVQTLIGQIAQFLPTIVSLPAQIETIQNTISTLPSIIKDTITETSKDMNTKDTISISQKSQSLKKPLSSIIIITNTSGQHMTFAEILSKTPTDSTTIRNINLVGNPETCKKTLTALKKDHICADNSIKSVK